MPSVIQSRCKRMMKPATILRTAILVALLAGTVAAHGFHSPLLRNKDPRRWAETVREELGLDRTDSAEETRASRAPFVRGRARQLVDVLKYLDKKNVLLREFPDFNYDNIPAFKAETEAILIAIGRDAVPLLLSTLITDLKGGNTGGDLSRAEDFIDRVVHILVAIGEDALDGIVLALGDPHWRVRAALIRMLRQIVVDPDFGKDVEGWRRWYRIRSAGRRGAGALVPDLVAHLEDPDRRIRLAAARALGEIGRREAAPALRQALGAARDETLRKAILRALVKMGDLESTPLFIDLLESPKPSLRQEAVTALRFLTRKMMGFNPRAPAKERAKAVDRWRAWWRSR